MELNVMSHLDFETVEQGEINIIKAENLRDIMGGALYYEICSDDVRKLRAKLERLKTAQMFKK